MARGGDSAAREPRRQHLRAVPADLDWSATVWSPRTADPLPRLNRQLRERVRFVNARELDLGDLLGRADVFCAASSGLAPVP